MYFLRFNNWNVCILMQVPINDIIIINKYNWREESKTTVTD